MELEELLWKANREGDGDFYQEYLRDDTIAVDGNTAIVTYHVEVTVVVDGNEQQFPSYASTVWTKAGGKWLVAFHQQTAL
ncbi:hypothetical protein GCM10009804_08430 [Kribbella hippodromi]|uniref:DUF4440 domain-containing protein n=1 Tax=Kribbella hippodromi TaxID=434347 RepID=A0ABN2C722_9ACTN